MHSTVTAAVTHCAEWHEVHCLYTKDAYLLQNLGGSANSSSRTDEVDYRINTTFADALYPHFNVFFMNCARNFGRK